MNSTAERERTIRQDLLILLLAAILAPFILITILYTYNVKNIIDTDVKSYQEAIIRQSGNNISNIFSNIKMIQRATIGKVISDYVPLTYQSSLDKNDIEKLKDLIGFLSITENASTFVNGIYVIFESGYTISSRNGIREDLLRQKKWIKDIKNSNYKVFITGLHEAEYNVSSPRKEYDIVMSFVQEFKLPEQNGEVVVVQIDIEKSAFLSFLGSRENTEQIPMYLFDMTQNNILIENENYHKYADTNAQDEIIIQEVINENHLILYAFIRSDMIMDKFYSSVIGIMLLIILIIIITILATIYYSRTMTAPLHELYLCMKSVGQGNFSPSYPRTHYKELSYLIRRFETMVNEVDDLLSTVRKQESETLEAKFQALQAKINPHFLYNTLDVIRSIALAYDHKDISDMTLSLARLFRYNVGDLKETNSLGTEIEYLNDYLKIQEYRFGDRIRTSFDINEEYREIQITRFILQPIVENAFKYGLELRGKGAVLRISAVHEGRFLIISIYDNGPGVSPEILQKLQHSFRIEPDIKSVTKAHGLDNVNLRMKLLYGEEYGLKIESSQGEWTRLDIIIPYGTES